MAVSYGNPLEESDIIDTKLEKEGSFINIFKSKQSTSKNIDV